MLKSLITSLLAVNLFAVSTAQVWSLKKTYQGSTFFDGFDFFTDADPTHGFVKYVDQATAQSAGLISTRGGKVIMRADNSTVSPNGRRSVRITSRLSYTNSALVLLDLEHMPVGCGTWPAFWMFGPDWPNNGEIDVSFFLYLKFARNAIANDLLKDYRKCKRGYCKSISFAYKERLYHGWCLSQTNWKHFN